MRCSASTFAALTAIVLSTFLVQERPAYGLLSSGVCTSQVTCAPGWSVSTSNGKNQHPEFVIMFWQDPLLVGGYQWNNGNGGSPNPTYSQVIASSLYLANSPFFAAATQYEGSGIVTRPRLAPYAPILSNVPTGSPPNTYTSSFQTSDIENAINEFIAAGTLPEPSTIYDPTDYYGHVDNTIYTVFLPAGAQNTGSFCQGAGGCNFGCNYRNAPEPSPHMSA